MGPKQWRTEYTSIQGMPGPLELRCPCNHLKKNCHSMKCPSNQETGVQREECQLPGTEHLGMRRPAR